MVDEALRCCYRQLKFESNSLSEPAISMSLRISAAAGAPLDGSLKRPSLRYNDDTGL